MNRLLIACLVLFAAFLPAASCDLHSTPTGIGGTSAAGGTVAAAGGKVATGGSVAQGGTSQAIEPPAPQCLKTFKAGPRVRYPIGRVLTNGRSMSDVQGLVSFVPDLTSVLNLTNDLKNFNQLKVGKCTAEAATGAVSTWPFEIRGKTEADTTALYSLATHLDDSEGISGQYPPDDTGSTGSAALRAIAKLGWPVFKAKPLISWTEAVSFEHMVTLMHKGPVIIGIGWQDSMFDLDSCGIVQVQTNAPDVGGHELNCFQWEAPRQLVWCAQSWGPTVGLKDERGATGRIAFTRAALTERLQHGGDALAPQLP